jgi:hypothetical protein
MEVLRKHVISLEVEAARRGRSRERAQRRRAALVAAGCATYELGVRDGMDVIQCLCCGLGSNHPQDVAQRYCGYCHEFHGEWKEGVKLDE